MRKSPGSAEGFGQGVALDDAARVPEVITMPRSGPENIDHAAELPDRPTSSDPRMDDGIDLEVYVALRDAINARAAAERAVADAVRAARRHGVSWATIGVLLGTSGDAVSQRYG